MYRIESKERKAYYWFFIIRDLGYFNGSSRPFLRLS